MPYRSIITFVGLGFLAFLILRKNQNTKLNWSVFYASLWCVLLLLPINYICTKIGFWEFQEPSHKWLIPVDIYFIWVLIWGIAAPLLLNGKHILLSTIFIIWIDLLMMPFLEKHGIVILNKNWIWGELLTIVFIYLPANYWAKFSLLNRYTGARTFLQFLSMAIFYCFLIPLSLFLFKNEIPTITFNIFLFQIMIILLLPAIIALFDLVRVGRGTPFPFDPTKKLINTGAYAYIRNPIQWSLTLFFIPLSIFYNEPLLLIGFPISILYTIGVSNFDESEKMKTRFGDSWNNYFKNTPAWFFLWKPKNISFGTLHYDNDCSICTQVMLWYKKRNPINLNFSPNLVIKGNRILQITYVDSYGNEYKSVKAIAKALEHINLFWASLGWLLRLPLVYHLTQAIIDSMGLKDDPKCEINTPQND